MYKLLILQRKPKLGRRKALTELPATRGLDISVLHSAIPLYNNYSKLCW